MKTGYLYEKTEEELKKDIKNNINVTLGIEVTSLLDTINFYEIKHNGESTQVLINLKYDLMLLLGKISENKEV
jgi:hypothetical protein